jgi:hypothetical protein
VNITGVLDQASATTLAIGTNNATAITLGKAGITATVAGALTSSQLLTASLGITVTGGTAATEKIARTAADTLDINNGAIISTASAITLAKATTISAGAFNVSANTTHAVGTAATVASTTWRTRSGSQTQVDAAGGDANNYYGAFTLSTGTEQRWWLLSGKSFNVYGGGADNFSILNAALATNLTITQAGAVTIPTATKFDVGGWVVAGTAAASAGANKISMGCGANGAGEIIVWGPSDSSVGGSLTITMASSDGSPATNALDISSAADVTMGPAGKKFRVAAGGTNLLFGGARGSASIANGASYSFKVNTDANYPGIFMLVDSNTGGTALAFAYYNASIAYLKSDANFGPSGTNWVVTFDNENVVITNGSGSTRSVIFSGVWGMEVIN